MNWMKENEQIGCVLTNRNGGVSRFPYCSNNLALHVGDNESDVYTNRCLLADRLQLPMESFVYMDQVHGTDIMTVGKNHITSFVCDGLITSFRQKVLMVMVADCVPLLFADQTNGVVGVAHAGWRGTVLGIAGKMVQKMEEVYHCNPHDIEVFVGPSILSCCYQVGEEVRESFQQAYPGMGHVFENQNNGFSLDLQEANRYILLNAGVKSNHISCMPICVSCHPDIYFSHRAEGGKTGRFAAGIWLK